jgi:hypothetical protein
LNGRKPVKAIMQIQRKAGYCTDVQQQEQYSRRLFEHKQIYLFIIL